LGSCVYSSYRPHGASPSLARSAIPSCSGTDHHPLLPYSAWLEDGALLRNAGKLATIAGVLVQGRLDLEAPLTTAWELAKAWPESELIVVENAAHSPDDDGMARAIVGATDRFGEILKK
jgi:pimeloyl-ACP methyl ester carboxylesterase